MAGIDWASSEHAVAVVDEHGVQLQRAVVPHTTAGLRQLVKLVRKPPEGSRRGRLA